MQEVIEHIENAREAIENVAKCIKNCAVITAPNGEYMDKHELDYHSWTPDTILDIFIGYDARVVDVNRETITVLMQAQLA